MNTQFFVERTTALPGALEADFAPLGGLRCWFRLKLRLKGD
jgi:hypothetical protein